MAGTFITKAFFSDAVLSSKFAVEVFPLSFILPKITAERSNAMAGGGALVAEGPYFSPRTARVTLALFTIKVRSNLKER